MKRVRIAAPRRTALSHLSDRAFAQWCRDHFPMPEAIFAAVARGEGGAEVDAWFAALPDGGAQ